MTRTTIYVDGHNLYYAGVKLVRHESGGNPFAIGVNGPYMVKPQPTSAAQAAATAHVLLRTPGVRSIDLGLAMINTNHLQRLGLSVEEAFEPCRNLGAMQKVLLTSYQKWEQVHGPGDAAKGAIRVQHRQPAARHGEWLCQKDLHAARPVGDYELFFQPRHEPKN